MNSKFKKEKYEIILKSINGLNPQKIATDLAGLYTNLPIRTLLEYCEEFMLTTKINYLDFLFIKMYKDGQYNEQDIENLKGKLSNNHALKVYIGRAAELARKSHSNRATILLAIYSGKVIVRPELAEEIESAVMLDILTNINDVDLEHFLTLYDYLVACEEKQIRPHQAYFNKSCNGFHYGKNLLTYFESDPIFASYLSSIEKITNLGLLSKGSYSYAELDSVFVLANFYSHEIRMLVEEATNLNLFTNGQH